MVELEICSYTVIKHIEFPQKYICENAIISLFAF